MAVVLEPSELIERLVALIPAPRRHLVRYHGSLAPNSKLRSAIVPAPPSAPPAAKEEREDPDAGGFRETAPAGSEGEGPDAKRGDRGSRFTWAELMSRVFEVDVLECPRCQGRLRIVATITQPEAIRAILECLGLPARPPPIAPAREDPQLELEFPVG